MKAVMLGACLAAMFGAPALAQPGDGSQSQTDPYYDQPPPPQPPPPAPQPAPYRSYQSDDQADQGYGAYQPPPGQPGFQNYQGGGSYQGYAPYTQTYRPAPQWRYGGAQYTGRSGRAWRNPEGQLCRWRQLTWQDGYGRQAYQWVPRCRGD